MGLGRLELLAMEEAGEGEVSVSGDGVAGESERGEWVLRVAAGGDRVRGEGLVLAEGVLVEV